MNEQLKLDLRNEWKPWNTSVVQSVPAGLMIYVLFK